MSREDTLFVKKDVLRLGLKKGTDAPAPIIIVCIFLLLRNKINREEKVYLYKYRQTT